MVAQPEHRRARGRSRSSGCPRRRRCRSGGRGSRRGSWRRPSPRARRSSRSSRSPARIRILVVGDDVQRDGAREANELARSQAGHVPGRARADPDAVEARAGSARENGVEPAAGTARRRRARSRLLLVRGQARRCSRVRSAGGGSDLRRIRAAVAGDHREDEPAVALEDERLHDVAQVAADRPRGVRGRGRPCGELLDPHFCAWSRRNAATRSTACVVSSVIAEVCRIARAGRGVTDAIHGAFDWLPARGVGRLGRNRARSSAPSSATPSRQEATSDRGSGARPRGSSRWCPASVRSTAA